MNNICEESLTECIIIHLITKGDVINVKVFYKECVPSNTAHSPVTLLLLHGAAFTSKTWQESVPTIQTMCALGYRVVAIDIPGTKW